MGNCCTNDRSLSMTSELIETLMSENLLTLKAISMHYIDRKEHSMSVRVLNIRAITKEHYKTISEDRKAALNDKLRQEEEDMNELEANMSQELQDLLRANESIKRFFYEIRRKFLVFEIPAQKFIVEFRSNENSLEDYKALKEQCKRYQRNGKGLISLADILNNGKEPRRDQKQILFELSKYTSHIANNPERRISYIPDTYFRNDSRTSALTYRFKSSSRSNIKLLTPRTEGSRRYTEF